MAKDNYWSRLLLFSRHRVGTIKTSGVLHFNEHTTLIALSAHLMLTAVIFAHHYSPLKRSDPQESEVPQCLLNITEVMKDHTPLQTGCK